MTQTYICCVEYQLGGVYRSNQATCRYQQPSVKLGIWIQAGDLLADSNDSLCGQFVVGRNLLLGYLPWDGLNFEDAVVASENLVTKEIFTNTHLEEWITSLAHTQLGIESFIPFSTRLVNCIGGRQRKLWVDCCFISKKRRVQAVQFSFQIDNQNCG